MKKQQKQSAVIASNGSSQAVPEIKWHLDVEITDWEEESSPVLEKGTFFVDGDYAYFDRAAYVCADVYYLTVRFNKDGIKDVVGYFIDNPQVGIDKFLETFDGYEVISSDHN